MKWPPFPSKLDWIVKERLEVFFTTITGAAESASVESVGEATTTAGLRFRIVTFGGPEVVEGGVVEGVVSVASEAGVGVGVERRKVGRVWVLSGAMKA